MAEIRGVDGEAEAAVVLLRQAASASPLLCAPDEARPSRLLPFPLRHRSHPRCRGWKQGRSERRTTVEKVLGIIVDYNRSILKIDEVL